MKKELLEIKALLAAGASRPVEVWAAAIDLEAEFSRVDTVAKFDDLMHYLEDNDYSNKFVSFQLQTLIV